MHSGCVIFLLEHTSHIFSLKLLLPVRRKPHFPNPAEMFKFEVPSLMVGTLDSLMTLSDDLGKTDQIVESIVRKIEKTAVELSGKKSTDLTVGGVPAPRYIQQFAWDYAKYPNRRPLKELVVLIAGGVQAIDEELKQLGQSYADKQAALQDAKRKKAGNLMVADLNDVLTAEDMSKVDVHDTEYLKTVMIAIPKAVKPQFEANISSLGKDIAGYGGKQKNYRTVTSLLYSAQMR